MLTQSHWLCVSHQKKKKKVNNKNAPAARKYGSYYKMNWCQESMIFCSSNILDFQREHKTFPLDRRREHTLFLFVQLKGTHRNISAGSPTYFWAPWHTFVNYTGKDLRGALIIIYSLTKCLLLSQKASGFVDGCCAFPSLKAISESSLTPIHSMDSYYDLSWLSTSCTVVPRLTNVSSYEMS